uniref:Reverse transcriptase domain-containing protein n=1 Tax=Fagus sylvatica TaxID=28930 RepID=A0A2N9I4W7_FAGSY
MPSQNLNSTYLIGECSSNPPNVTSSALDNSSYADFRLELPSNQTIPKSLEHTLIGKIVSLHKFNSILVHEVVSKAWNPKGSIKVSTVGKNLFVFSFENETDCHFAFSRRPWTLKGAHLILREWKPRLTWEEVDFTTSTFWVQVHGLPGAWQLEDNLKRIGNKVGIVKEIDFVDDGRFFWRRFIRLRIEVDITKPLIPGVFLPRPELNDLWIGLKYEKLPEFGEKFIAYGPWLRLENELTPPGIYDRSSNLEASNSDEETPATRRESEQENSPSTRQDNQETAKLKEDNKKSNRQNEVEQQNGITSLARLMAEALQADCSVGVHDAEEETNLTILATKQQSLTFPKSVGLMKLRIVYRRRLRSSPAGPNEAGEFELPWAWEPTVSSRTSLSGEVRRSPGCFSNGNMLAQKKIGKAQDSYSKSHIDGEIIDGNEVVWRFSGFYGDPVIVNRIRSWQLLRCLHSQSSTPWLDRGVCSKAWLDLHPNARIKHVSMATSDHLALILDTLGSNQGFTRRKTRFRFEQAWVKDPAYEGVVTDAWTTGVEGTRMFCVLLQHCEENLEVDQNREKANQLRRELNTQLEEEELYWQQRSRVCWLKEGDKNMKFFHAFANQRRRTNEITMLRDNHGAQITGEAGLEHVCNEYFRNIFTTSNPGNIDVVVNAMDQVVSQDMNDSLLFPITEEEVKIALFQMNPSKAPGPDGMSALFFQKYWHVIGTDITSAVLDCISSRKLLKSVNYMHIALIPKVANPESMGQFRPISLCNVLYKLVSKVLVNRLKQVLSKIISDSQSAFVPGRLITDNVLLAFEALHYMKNKRRGGVTHLAAKLDMSKAYDRVEWSYLKAVMLKMGFDCRWVDLMMECISIVSYSILLNGTPTGHIIPSRGLRQGDPLSPYLFLICAEGFTSLIRKAENQKLIQGISISRGGPRFSHLFFADDSIIFCRAKIEECRALREILKLYEDASGQKLNMEKTSLFFSANTPEAVKEEIQTEMGVLSMNQMEKYLGLPPIIAGKEVLIKAVAQAIPTYAMSVFQLPVACSNEINSMLSNYWWGQKQGERRIHWMGWKKLARSKKWNVPLIDEIFEASEAAIIKSIPLSNRISSDVLIWSETRNGMYSVKSAYHLLMEAKQRNEASESSNTSRERDLWKGIWEASVPQKIKLFIWKACKGILPTKLNLFRKKVSNSFTCEFCDEEPESVEHVLVECQFAQEVWGLSPIVNVQQWPSFQNFADVVTHGLQVLNFPDVEIMFTIAWRLWLARNDRIWENHNTLARDICSQAGFLVTEFLDHQQNDSGMLPNAPSKWQPPNAPVYKINVAVSWRKQSRSGSVGTVVRDSLGQVIAAMCDVSSSFAEVSQFNAFAIQKSLLLAKNLGLHNVMVEGECRELLGFLRSPEPCLAPYGSLVDDIRLTASFFSYIQYFTISHLCNLTSFTLAQEAFSFGCCKVWIEECPHFLFTAVQNDLP